MNHIWRYEWIPKGEDDSIWSPRMHCPHGAEETVKSRMDFALMQIDDRCLGYVVRVEIKHE